MPVTGEEGLAVLRVLDAARESARADQVVHLR
jgi:predicted dehydrogenase